MAKQCKFKGTDEDVISFLDSFGKLFTSDGRIGLLVKAKNNYNRFLLVVDSEEKDSTLPPLVVPGYTNVTVPALNKMIEKRHPMMMLRSCNFISLKDLAALADLDKADVYREVFKALKNRTTAAAKSSQTGQF